MGMIDSFQENPLPELDIYLSEMFSLISYLNNN